ncbi:MAG: phage holin family protein [Rikenellaceae bacterium]
MMLNNNSSTTLMVQGSAASVLAPFVYDSISVAIPFFVVALLLIILDLWLGIGAAIVRHEQILFTVAVRKTLSKVCEYICWVMLAATISIAFACDYVRYSIMAFVLILESVSLLRNLKTVRRMQIKAPLLALLYWGVNSDFYELIKDD